MSKKKRLGIALGAGSARGFAHVGVLKVLDKHNIKPDYLAGTSMGAVIAAAYAAGRSVEDMEQILKKTDWNNLLDFTKPKLGLLQGKEIEKKLSWLFFDKEFKDLKIPLRVVAYNLTKNEKVVFKSGDVASAVRASISIPGIFTPFVIKGDEFVDGAIADPTPYEVARKMGADVVIAVDLFSSEEKTVTAPKVTKQSLYMQMKRKFVQEELKFLKAALYPEDWPILFKRVYNWAFDKLLYPKRILRMFTGKEFFPVTKILYDSVTVLTNNLARERLRSAPIDILVKPSFRGLTWASFDKVGPLINRGKKAMLGEVSRLKKLL